MTAAQAYKLGYDNGVQDSIKIHNELGLKQINKIIEEANYSEFDKRSINRERGRKNIQKQFLNAYDTGYLEGSKKQIEVFLYVGSL